MVGVASGVSAASAASAASLMEVGVKEDVVVADGLTVGGRVFVAGSGFGAPSEYTPDVAPGLHAPSAITIVVLRVRTHLLFNKSPQLLC
jgi:hypothetical protein